MNRSSERDDDRGNAGGQFSVDGQAIEIDMAEWGWDRETTTPALDEGRGDEEGTVRLQKALANAGVASRRACETLITSGRVSVNGEEERELGSRVNPDTDEVRVDGVVVQLDTSKRYFVLNKPVGVVSTMHDEHGRPDLREFTDQVEDRLYNVGRLDTDTSGLLILTNDGELAHKLAHPSFGVEKTYIAKVRGRVTAAVIQRMLDGVELKDGPMRADRAKLLPNGSTKTHSLVELTIHSGKNRIVRRFLAELGHPVEDLVRRQFGPLNLGTLRAGELRELSAGERGALLSAHETGADGDAAGASRTGGRGPQGGEARGGNRQEGGGRQGGGHRGQRGKAAGGASGKGGRGGQRPITAGRPGDGKGARGMRGIAARGNPNAGRGQSGDAQGRSDGGRGRPMERGWVDNPWEDSRGSDGSRGARSSGGSRGGQRSDHRSGERRGSERGSGPRDGGHRDGGQRGGPRGGGPRGGGPRGDGRRGEGRGYSGR